MAISLNDFIKISKARLDAGMRTELTLGESNEISVLHDRSIRTDCVNFNRDVCQCESYGWNFCLRMLSGECDKFKRDDRCKECRFALNPKYRTRGGKLITLYECERKKFADVYEDDNKCELFEDKQCYAAGSCGVCRDDCKNHERCTAVGSNKCDHCFVNQCKEYDANEEE